MIERLTALRLSGFRGYLEPMSVLLDGDVVLVYGPNAAGKTSLIAGIEYALTGSVADLKGLKDDYPRCLAHVRASELPTASVGAVGRDGSVLEFATARGTSRHLAPKEARLFRERSYLSQNRLARLLDIYRQTDSESAEETLVSFVRDLLRLDHVEALTEGLHEAGDIRRLRKAVPGYDRLRLELDRLTGRVDELSAEAKRLERTLSQRVDRLTGHLREHQLLDWEARITPDGFEELDRALTQELEGIARGQTRQTARKHRALLDRARELFPDVEEQADSLAELRGQLKKSRVRREKLENVLEPFVRQGRELLRVTTPATDLSMELRLLRERAQAERLRLRARLQKLEQDAATRLILEGEAADARRELDEIEAEMPEETARLQRLAQLLTEARELHDQNDCPVCGRDFAETGAGTLREHIDRQLVEITDQATQLSKVMERRASLLANLRRAESKLSTLPAADSADLPALGRRVETISAYAAGVEGVEPAARERDELRKTELGLGERISLMERRAETRLALFQAAESKDSFATEGPKDIGDLISRLEASAARAESLAAARESALETALKECESALQLSRQVTKVKGQRDNSDRQLELLSKARGRVDALARTARGIRDVAAEAKRELIEEVFTESLNSLWVDLFQRLTNSPQQFSPYLEAQVLPRGNIRAGMLARSSAAAPFRYLGSVLSAGNVNTAALSLFLALHLANQSGPRVIILDDPVQSMDDVHAMEFASLLSFIAYQAHRQVIVAVHERPLFDYLCDQLAPGAEGQRLVAIEVDAVEGASVATDRVIGVERRLSQLGPTG